MSIDILKARDGLLVKETGVKAVARLVGYNEIGDPIELVFDAATWSYEWHVGGEYVADASQQAIVQFFPANCTIGAFSSNGRTPDFESENAGSIPAKAAI